MGYTYAIFIQGEKMEKREGSFSSEDNHWFMSHRNYVTMEKCSADYQEFSVSLDELKIWKDRYESIKYPHCVTEFYEKWKNHSWVKRYDVIALQKTLLELLHKENEGPLWSELAHEELCAWIEK